MRTNRSKLRLNRRNSCCLGVCSGIADWLDVPAALVRIVFIICALSWPTLIVGYFVLYFFLDKGITTDKMRDYFDNAKTAEHFKRLDYRKPIYKNTRNKRIAGVCSGIADYFEVSAFAVRALTLLSFFIFGPFTCLAYIICMFVFEADPHAVPSSRHERRMRRMKKRLQRRREKLARKYGRRNSYVNEEYESFSEEAGRDEAEPSYGNAQNRQAETENKQEPSKYSENECTEIYSSLELRLREIEAYITSKKFRLHCEINRI